MAGWGDDPVLEELRTLVAAGWTAVEILSTRQADTVTLEHDGERRTLTSDHIAFHRFAEGLEEDHPGITRRA